MKCPFCGSDDLKVLETRNSKDNRVRRRRECTNCGRRFTTYEYIEHIPLMVRKKDGRIERFQIDKVIRGLQKACEKRCDNMEQIREIAERVRQDLIARGEEEVSSKEIGELVMKHLRGVDRVAYIRFASVYRNFNEINDFHKVIEEAKNEVC